MAKNMVFMTEKYVFINSKVKADEEIGKKIKSLPKTFVQSIQKLCKYVTEYGYDEHTKEAILVCRFDNENEFCETTRMDLIARSINEIHKRIAKLICDDLEKEKEIAENAKLIENLINVKDENEETCDAH